MYNQELCTLCGCCHILLYWLYLNAAAVHALAETWGRDRVYVFIFIFITVSLIVF